MHELSIAHNLVEIASDAALREGAKSVSKVYLRLGVMSGVVKHALLFTYDIATKDTPLEGSELIIEDVPLVVHCASCDANQELHNIQLFQCPTCGTPTADIRQGREIEITTLELHYDEEVAL
jgi:hydrogenase nickel incorporation protein HypA/HybF